MSEIASPAVFTELAGWQVPAHYGDALGEYRNTCTAASIFDMSHRGKVVLSGADSGKFLHNLSTADIAGLPVGNGCEGYLCTAQARVIAPILVYRVPVEGHDEYWLDLDPGLAEKVVKHLDRFLISEVVEIADRTRAYAQIHLAGPQARQTVAKAFGGEMPELQELQHRELRFGADATVQVRRHDPLGFEGYDIVCPTDTARQAWSALLQAGARPAGQEAYDLLRVEAGTPVFGTDITEDRLVFDIGRYPQAVCYTKGCYLGQEPIVMARDRGHANRKLMGLKIAGQDAVPSGARVLRDGKEVGQVTSSVVSPRLGQAIALAYIRRGNQEPGMQMEIEVDGARRTAEVSSLPFFS